MPDAPVCCPRRGESPLGNVPGASDRWRSGAEVWGDGRDHTHFPPGVSAPRTCSYCGSAHPEDVLTLMAAGWENERATGKNYKGYLHVPGTLAALAQLGALPALRQLVSGAADPDDSPWRAPIPRDASPPVKFYVPHFTPEQLTRLNAEARGDACDVCGRMTNLHGYCAMLRRWSHRVCAHCSQRLQQLVPAGAAARVDEPAAGEVIDACQCTEADLAIVRLARLA